jgi:signal transduction histidine kinase
VIAKLKPEMKKLIPGFLLLFLLIFIASCEQKEELSPDEILVWNKQIAEAYVQTMAASIGEAATEISDSVELVGFIRRVIDPICFYPDSSGYFYVYNFNCVNIAHARQKDLEGQNLHDYTDSRGKYVIRELSAVAQSGGGYVVFYWIKPGETGEKRKLGYVKPIPNTEYFIGTGVYLE